MKVIAFNGGPRKNWNTAALLEKALDPRLRSHSTPSIRISSRTNEPPRSKLRGIKDSKRAVEKCELISMNLMVRSALLFYILADCLFIAVLPDGVRVVAACPELSSPKHFLHFTVCAEYLPGSDAFHDLHNYLWGHHGYTLNEEVHMIFIGSNFHEMDLMPFRNTHTDLFQSILHCFTEYLPPVLHRAYYVVKEKRLVVSLVDMFAHASILLHGTGHSDVYRKGIRAAQLRGMF